MTRFFLKDIVFERFSKRLNDFLKSKSLDPNKITIFENTLLKLAGIEKTPSYSLAFLPDTYEVVEEEEASSYRFKLNIVFEGLDAHEAEVFHQFLLDLKISSATHTYVLPSERFLTKKGWVSDVHVYKMDISVGCNILFDSFIREIVKLMQANSEWLNQYKPAARKVPIVVGDAKEPTEKKRRGCALM